MNPKQMMNSATLGKKPMKKKKTATYKGEKMPLSDAVDKAFENLSKKKGK